MKDYDRNARKQNPKTRRRWRSSIKIFTLLTFLCSVLLLFYSAGCQFTSLTARKPVLEKIEKAFSVKAGGSLTIVSEFGAIDIQTAEQDKVEVVVTKESKPTLVKASQEVLEDFEVTFEHKGSNVSIEGKFKQGRKHWQSRKHWQEQLNRLKIHFLVTVPRQYNIDLDTSSGSISVDDLDGYVRTETSAGGLRFGKIKGTVWGRTSAGNIKLTSCDSAVDVKTSAGNIELKSVGGNVNAKTSSGSIRTSLAGQPENECNFRTSAGNITVILMPDIAINLDAETTAGLVSTDFTVTSTIQGKVRKNWLKDSIKGSISGGGPLLRLRTSAGNIRLQQAEN